MVEQKKNKMNHDKMCLGIKKGKIFWKIVFRRRVHIGHYSPLQQFRLTIRQSSGISLQESNS